ncbi:MAG: tetratricopeptide repeat protein, partial [Thermodesulfobacteriota bacterium]
ILGQSFLYAGKTDNALKVFTQMNEMLPESIEVFHNLALTRLARQEYPQAIPLLEEILRIKPDYTPALATLAAIDMQNKQPKKAIERVRHQQEKYPDNPGNLLLLGDLLFRQGELEAASTAFHKAQALVPENPQPYIMIARIMEKSGKGGEAIAQYQSLLKNQPDSLQALMGLGPLYEQSGKPEEAKKTYRQLLERDPKFAPAANNLAWLLTQEANPDLGEALRLALIAKERLPNDPNISDTLGFIHYKRDAYDLATTQFREALVALPNVPTIRYHLALSLKGQGADDEALRELKECLRENIEFPERKEAMELLRSWQSSR